MPKIIFNINTLISAIRWIETSYQASVKAIQAPNIQIINPKSKNLFKIKFGGI